MINITKAISPITGGSLYRCFAEKGISGLVGGFGFTREHGPKARLHARCERNAQKKAIRKRMASIL